MGFEIGFGQAQTSGVSISAVRGGGDFGAALKAARETAAAAADSSVTCVPPLEVTQAIGAASAAYEALHATGQQLHFTVDRPTGALEVELRDLDGNALSTISASEVLRIAGGKSLN
jgi:hypothetical protein